MKIDIYVISSEDGERIEQNVRQALAETKVEAEVQIMSAGVMMATKPIILAPTLYINGQPKATGRVPSVDEIKEWIKDTLF